MFEYKVLFSYFLQDIIHCHDWSSAPVAWLFKDEYMHYGLSKARIVFTIHNLEVGAKLIGKAMAYADKATTVNLYDVPCDFLFTHSFIFSYNYLCEKDASGHYMKV